MRPILILAIVACLGGCSSVPVGRQAVGDGGTEPIGLESSQVSREIRGDGDGPVLTEVSRRTEIHSKFW